MTAVSASPEVTPREAIEAALATIDGRIRHVRQSPFADGCDRLHADIAAARLRNLESTMPERFRDRSSLKIGRALLAMLHETAWMDDR
ncbi:MAG: hypothetical protein AB7V42_12715 [Thermoleophilia bacterium]